MEEVTHVLRDGEEADAGKQKKTAGVAAGPGEGRQSDPSRGSQARHAHAWPHALAIAQNHAPLDVARYQRAAHAR